MNGRRALSPVLLLGAGSGEATCGILYLAGYLRRNGIEAFVRLYDRDVTAAEVTRSLEATVARVRPKLVGISLKWFHHVDRALLLARTLRKIDPEIEIVFGGNSASYWWRELAAYDCIDHIVLGDGEVPLLALCQGDLNPPNCVTRDPDGTPRRLPLAYVQGAKNTEDIHYSNFDEIFLSKMDASAFSGWVAPGKGCGENCLYCGGARGNQKAAFGRAKPFLRSEECVRRDHQEIANRTWQLRYDFSGSTAEFLSSTWAGVDLSRHSCMYFLWGVARSLAFQNSVAIKSDGTGLLAISGRTVTRFGANGNTVATFNTGEGESVELGSSAPNGSVAIEIRRGESTRFTLPDASLEPVFTLPYEWAFDVAHDPAGELYFKSVELQRLHSPDTYRSLTGN